MGRRVDVDGLIDTRGVAKILGLSQPNSVRVYRSRYNDFPEPVVNLGAGRCLLWLRADIEAWARQTGRRTS